MSREPADIDPADCDGLGEEDDEWGDDLMNDLERRFNELIQVNGRLETSSDKDVEKNITLDKHKLKKGTIELFANQIYDSITKLFNERRKN